MNDLTIIIGAGPVALYFAILLKIEQPEMEIIMFEKRKEYTRTHIVEIHWTSFICLNLKLQLVSLMQELSGKHRLCDIENTLCTFAIKQGIEIINKNIENITELADIFNPKYIINATGFHGLQDDKSNIDVCEIMSVSGQSCKEISTDEIEILKERTKRFLVCREKKINDTVNFNIEIFIHPNEHEEQILIILDDVLKRKYSHKPLELEIARSQNPVELYKNTIIYKIGDINVAFPLKRSINVGFLTAKYLSSRMTWPHKYTQYCSVIYEFERYKCEIKKNIIYNLMESESY